MSDIKKKIAKQGLGNLFAGAGKEKEKKKTTMFDRDEDYEVSSHWSNDYWGGLYGGRGNGLGVGKRGGRMRVEIDYASGYAMVETHELMRIVSEARENLVRTLTNRGVNVGLQHDEMIEEWLYEFLGTHGQVSTGAQLFDIMEMVDE